MTTPTPHGAPELPELPEHIAHMHSGGDFCLDRVVRAEGWPINVYTADQMREYARAAIQQAAGAVPDGMQLVPIEPTEAMIAASGLRFDIAATAVYRAMLAASPSPLGRQSGSSDHLVPCAGGGVTQPLTEDQILDHVVAVWPGGANTRGILEFTRAIEAAHGINPGSAPREDGHG